MAVSVEETEETPAIIPFIAGIVSGVLYSKLVVGKQRHTTTTRLKEEIGGGT